MRIVSNLFYLACLALPLLITQWCKMLVVPKKSIMQVAPVPDPPSSFVNVQVESYYGDIVNGFPDRFPERVSTARYNDWLDTKGPDEGGYSAGYDFQKSNVSFSSNQKQLTLDIQYKYWIDIRYRAVGILKHNDECKNLTLSNRLIFEMELKPDWTPVLKKDIKTSTTPPCKAFFGFDLLVAKLGKKVNVSDLVDKKFNDEIRKKTFDEIQNEFDAKFNKRKMLEEDWNQLQEPLLLGKHSDSDIYLTLHPQEFFLSSFDFSDLKLKYACGLKFSPVISIGNKPTPVKTALPNWSAGDDVSVFKIQCPVDISYSAIKSAIEKFTKLPNGTPKRYPPAGNKFITIESVEIDEYGDKLGIMVFVGGNKLKKGSYFYFEAKPHFDYATKTFYVSEINYSAETKNLILKKLVWFADQMDIFKEKLEDDILRVSIAREITDMKNLIDAKINSKVGNYQLTGSVQDFDLVNVMGDGKKDKIRFYFTTRGTMSAKVVF